MGRREFAGKVEENILCKWKGKGLGEKKRKTVFEKGMKDHMEEEDEGEGFRCSIHNM